MIEGIPFGRFHFEIALILRNILLVSSMLCNSEAWYNITKAELTLLESIDVRFLKGLLKTPKSTPKEAYYLELGCLPFRYIIRQRRLSFLHYILNQDEESLLFRFFKSQNEHRKKKDWTTQIY